jgi:hypothetical protein
LGNRRQTGLMVDVRRPAIPKNNPISSRYNRIRLYVSPQKRAGATYSGLELAERSRNLIIVIICLFLKPKKEEEEKGNTDENILKI